ncbi:MAG: GntR family transcriptional regulator [Roseivirga sp.]|nr:GntR family transcriptional regulator [Roseivirga sp.]
MIEIGKTQKLKIAREVEFGMYLTDGENEVLLPEKYIPFGCEIGDDIEVFVYNDSKNRPVAVTGEPLAKVGDLVSLEVVHVTQVGAFMDIGLEKDLMVPFREQQTKLEEGKRYAVKVLMDFKTNRMIGTTKLTEFMEEGHEGLEEGEEVDIIIWQRTDLGFRVIINQKYEGLIYQNEIFQDVQSGDTRKAFIKKLREDGKIDVALQRQGYTVVRDMSSVVLQKIEESGGVLNLGDKSSPEDIKEQLGMSKKNFKKILGGLYKSGKVEIFNHEVRIKAEG